MFPADIIDYKKAVIARVESIRFYLKICGTRPGSDDCRWNEFMKCSPGLDALVLEEVNHNYALLDPPSSCSSPPSSPAMIACNGLSSSHCL
jgi:hypothetical protein